MSNTQVKTVSKTVEESDKSDNDTEGGDVNYKLESKHFTLKQKAALVMMACADFMSYSSMSIMAPFYPKEAESKGMTESMAGLVFGFYALIMFISSPIYGKILPKIGLKLSFIGGLFISGVFSVAFGAINTVEDYHTFTLLSFVIRGASALGASAYTTAAFVLVINIFPDNAGAVRGLLETFVGLGLSVGPGIGGILFAFGGFGLPFYILGGIVMLLAPMNVVVLPPAKKCDFNTKTGSLWSLLKLPVILMTCVMMAVVSMTWGFLDPTLEPHLRQFNLGPSKVGLIFLLLSAAYGLSCPIWGWLCDKLENYWWLMTTGLFCNSLMLLLLGPSPMLSVIIEDSIWLKLFALSILGIFVAMALMPTYQFILDNALDSGFSDDLGTHAVVAGIWSSVYSLGEVVGPILGGALVEKYGFASTSTFFSALNLCLAVIGTIFFAYNKRTGMDVTTESSFVVEDVKKECYINDTEITVEKPVKNGFRIENLKTK